MAKKQIRDVHAVFVLFYYFRRALYESSELKKKTHQEIVHFVSRKSNGEYTNGAIGNWSRLLTNLEESGVTPETVTEETKSKIREKYGTSSGAPPKPVFFQDLFAAAYGTELFRALEREAKTYDSKYGTNFQKFAADAEKKYLDRLSSAEKLDREVAERVRIMQMYMSVAQENLTLREEIEGLKKTISEEKELKKALAEEKAELERIMNMMTKEEQKRAFEIFKRS